LTGSDGLDSSKGYASRKLSDVDALCWANKTWEGQKQIAESMALKAIRLAREAYEKNPAFFESRSRKWILGGLFYLLGKRNGVAKTQKQMAQSLDTNEMTIRASYREWLAQFPEFWSETTQNRMRALGLNEKKPIRVLHVDDERGFLQVAKQCLEIIGHFQVDTASSAEEAMEKVKKEKYDAVVCDYQMPGEDGLQFLMKLREKGDSIPFIIFTVRGREEVAIKALNLGADRYLNKFGDPEVVYAELAHSVRQAVERRKYRQI
jgi:CheY-like chemotaxis protein